MKRFLSAAFAAPLLLVSASAFAGESTRTFAPELQFDPTGLLLLGFAVLVAACFVAPKAARGTIAALAVLVVCSMACNVAFAANAAPETVAQASSETTRVVWGWGASLAEATQAIAWLLASLAMVLLRKLPANIVAIFGNARVELLLNNAIAYGLNAVEGAIKGKVLEVDVGNKVLAQALQYAVDNAPGWLQSWAGGPEGLAKKIWGRLNLGPGADDAAIPAAIARVEA